MEGANRQDSKRCEPVESMSRVGIISSGFLPDAETPPEEWAIILVGSRTCQIRMRCFLEDAGGAVKGTYGFPAKVLQTSPRERQPSRRRSDDDKAASA